MTETATRQRGPAEARSSAVGADEALTTLVSQFADPLVFLRELVQNSLDASSTQISIETSFEAEGAGKKKSAAGVMTIAILDNGEGMTEHIIDNYLLTLFSSTKEDDLTKIGKFGVGFVSIFAIEPDLVVCDTGQAGESWRVLFHADRSFEKMRVDEPVEGTTITLHKRVTRGEFADLRVRAAHTVRYWCKYAEAEIDVDGDPVSEDLGLGAATLTVNHAEPGTELIVGFPPVAQPRADSWHEFAGEDAAGAVDNLVGFYNRGLTLVEGGALPDEHSGDLAGISMRVKSRYLEHTLTRDNVRADDNYYKAIELVRGQVHSRLRPRLIEHLEAIAAHLSAPEEAPDPGDPGVAACLLYARLPAMNLDLHAPGAAILPTTGGEPLSLRGLRGQRTIAGGYAVAEGDTPLTAALADDGVRCLLAVPAVTRHLAALDIDTVDVHARFYTAREVDVPDHARALLPRLERLLGKARTRVSDLVFGDFDYPHSAAAGRLYVRQENAFGLTEIDDDDEATFFGGARTIVLGWKHPLVERCSALAAKRPALAAHILAQAIAVYEARDRDRRAALAAEAVAWSRV